MADTAATFISELVRAANETERLTGPERAAILLRAANTIRDYRDEIDFSDTPANDRGGPDDIVFCLHEMARLIDLFSAKEVEETLIEAAGVIRTAKILLDAKREIEGEAS